MEIVKELLRSGRLDLNRQLAETGQTALHVAVKTSNADLVRLLQGAGASMSIADNHGRTPLELARAIAPTGREVIELLGGVVHELTSAELRLRIRQEVSITGWHYFAPVLKEFNRIEALMQDQGGKLVGIGSLVRDNNQKLTALASDCNQTKNLLLCQDQMLRTLLRDAGGCPRFFLLVPKPESGTALDALHTLCEPRRWFTKPLMLVLFCPCCLEQAECGPDGQGFELRQPTKMREQLLKLAPAIRFSLWVVKVALQVMTPFSIPLPGGDAATFTAKADKAVSHLIEAANPECQEKLQKLTAALENATNTSISGDRSRIMDVIEGATGEAYRCLKGLLNDPEVVGHGSPRLGLELVAGGRGENSACEFVCKSCAEGFSEEGIRYKRRV